MDKNIADIRTDYRLHSLNESDIAAGPIEQFTRWWNDAINSEIPEVNAMTLATAGKDGKPSASSLATRHAATAALLRSIMK